MKKIMHIVFSLGSGGLENMVVDIANVQSKKYKVQIVVINNLVDQTVINRILSTVDVVYLARKPKSKSVKPLFNFYKNYLNFSPDLVHIHCRQALKLFPARIFKWRPSVIYTEHDTGTQFGYEIKNANSICAISDAVRNDLANRENINAVTVYNGIPSEQIKYKDAINNITKVRVVQISRLMPEKKGQDILLKALADIKKMKPSISIEVDFIGGGDARENLQQLADDLGVTGSVNFLGVMPKDDVYAQLQSYDILIQPSRYEGFGLTLAEGMVAGVPVIGSDSEGPMEVIGNEKYGKVFKTGCHNSLANKIMETLENYKTGAIKEQVVAARKRACEQFDIDKTAEHYAQF